MPGSITFISDFAYDMRLRVAAARRFGGILLCFREGSSAFRLLWSHEVYQSMFTIYFTPTAGIDVCRIWWLHFAIYFIIDAADAISIAISN